MSLDEFIKTPWKSIADKKPRMISKPQSLEQVEATREEQEQAEQEALRVRKNLTSTTLSFAKLADLVVFAMTVSLLKWTSLNYKI